MLDHFRDCREGAAVMGAGLCRVPFPDLSGEFIYELALSDLGSEPPDQFVSVCAQLVAFVCGRCGITCIRDEEISGEFIERVHRHRAERDGRMACPAGAFV